MQVNVAEIAAQVVAQNDFIEDSSAPAVDLSEIALREEMTLYICTTNWPF